MSVMRMMIRVPWVNAHVAITNASDWVRRWASSYTVRPAKHDYAEPLRSTVIVVEREDEGTGTSHTHELTARDITRAIGIMAETYPTHYANLMTPTCGDAITGDALIQIACFGNLKYG